MFVFPYLKGKVVHDQHGTEIAPPFPSMEIEYLNISQQMKIKINYYVNIRAKNSSLLKAFLCLPQNHHVNRKSMQTMKIFDQQANKQIIFCSDDPSTSIYLYTYELHIILSKKRS